MATRPELYHPARLTGLTLALALAFCGPRAWAGPVAPAHAAGSLLQGLPATPAPARAAPAPLPAPVRVAAATPPTAAPAVPAAPAASTPLPALPRTERKAAKALAVGCIISPDRVAEIGSPVVGIVRDLKVDTGDAVRGGQPLVTLQSEVESAGVKAAQARSQIDADVRAAEANLGLARQRHERAIELQGKGFVSGQAIDQARAELEVADQRLQQARGQQNVAQRELGVVRAQLDQRVLRSPFDGVITERYVNLGERVEDRPLMRVAMLDPLRVELVLPAHRYGSVARNELLSVQPDLPGVASVSARVSHVDKVIDAASNTFRVRLRLPNPGHRLPAGARCKLLDAVDTAGVSPLPATPPVPKAKQAAARPAPVAKVATAAGVAAPVVLQAAAKAKRAHTAQAGAVGLGKSQATKIAKSTTKSTTKYTTKSTAKAKRLAAGKARAARLAKARGAEGRKAAKPMQSGTAAA